MLVDFSFSDMHGDILLLEAHTTFTYTPLFWGSWLKSLPILSPQREQTFLPPQKKTHYRRMLLTTFLPVMLSLSPLASYNSSAVSWVLKETSPSPWLLPPSDELSYCLHFWAAEKQCWQYPWEHHVPVLVAFQVWWCFLLICQYDREEHHAEKAPCGVAPCACSWNCNGEALSGT